MKKYLNVEENAKLSDVLKTIHSTHDQEIEVTGSEELFRTILNKEVVKLFGHSLGKKIVFRSDLHPHHPAPETPAPHQNLGFVEGKDLAGEGVAPPPTPPAKEDTAPSESPLIKKKRFKFSLPKGPKWVYAGIGGAVFLIFAGFLAFWFLPSATVTLLTTKEVKESENSLIASESVKEADLEKGVIPLKKLESVQEDFIDAKATGSKTIGDKAKGRVNVINRETTEKTFVAGVIIRAITGAPLTFSLDESLTIPGSPSGCTSDCQSRAVNVTATQIGSESNLPQGSKFQIGSVTDTTKVVGESTANFTGGTSRQVTVVSATDQTKAKEDLMKKLQEKAISELKDKNKGIVIPENGLDPQIQSELYDKKVDEEAEQFKLTMVIKFIANTFSEEDLKEVLTKSILPSIPTDYKIDEENAKISSEILEKTATEIKLIGKIKAPLIPSLDEKEIKDNIAGKDFSTVDRYLKSLGSVAGFEISIRPTVFKIFGIVPFAKSKIKLDIKQED